MFWIIRLLFGKSEYLWLPVRILKETDRAVLVENYRKMWIVKSKIVKIRLKKGVFEIYIKNYIVK
ncbi:MAG: hypothetical protein ABII88_04180 [Candidatus Omnitrophota bacterium]